MKRRRRQPRETAFSFDSFLDLVTNVVGIIIRLILVAWVGARTYSSIAPSIESNPPPVARDVRSLSDPLEDELARQRAALAEAEARLLEQLRQLDLLQTTRQQVEQELAGLDTQQRELEKSKAYLGQQTTSQSSGPNDLALTLQELDKRRQQLLEQLKDLEKQPPKKTLRYRTPVSQTVHGEEFHFECRSGKVAYINRDELLPQVRRGIRGLEKQLQHQWQLEEVTEPVGAFRLRYVIGRQRGVMDAAVKAVNPDPYDSFSYGLTSWEVEPITRERGEPAEAALAPGSEFRRVVDPLASADTSVTLWVYPDSFPLYRQLRDYLTDLGCTVSGRPLPPNAPIAASSRGTRSRGQ